MRISVQDMLCQVPKLAKFFRQLSPGKSSSAWRAYQRLNAAPGGQVGLEIAKWKGVGIMVMREGDTKGLGDFQGHSMGMAASSTAIPPISISGRPSPPAALSFCP